MLKEGYAHEVEKRKLERTLLEKEKALKGMTRSPMTLQGSVILLKTEKLF